jgi:hypothetical protein
MFKNKTAEISSTFFWHMSDGLTIDYWWLIGEDPYYW